MVSLLGIDKVLGLVIGKLSLLLELGLVSFSSLSTPLSNKL